MMKLSPSLLIAFGFCALIIPTLSAAELPPQEDPYEIPMEDLEGEGGLSQEELEALAAVIIPRVAELRGWEWKKEVPVGITTPDEFVAFAEGSFDEEYGADRLAGMTSSYVLFGFMPAEMNFQQTMMDMLRSQVGGYYDPKEGKFFMMSTFNKGAMADYIMAHELTHALDDQYFDLEAIFDQHAGNSDTEFAIRSAVEGSASSAGNLYLMKGIRNQWLDASTMMDGDMINAMMGTMDKVPPYFIINMSLPYIDGNTFVLRQTSESFMAAMMMAPADEDLQHMFRDPPTSSEQILHPEKYWDEDLFDAPIEVEVADRSESLGAGWSLVDTDTLGELGCAMLVMKNVPTAMAVSMGGARMAVPESSGWGGDQYRAYLNEDGRKIMHWSTVWDSQADAVEFAAALRSRGMERAPMMRSIDLQGTRVNVVFASDDAVADMELL
ncbi:MAG: hypothetical protein QM477_09065 [Planctomycetota bacterium]